MYRGIHWEADPGDADADLDSGRCDEDEFLEIYVQLDARGGGMESVFCGSRVCSGRRGIWLSGIAGGSAA